VPLVSAEPFVDPALAASILKSSAVCDDDETMLHGTPFVPCVYDEVGP